MSDFGDDSDYSDSEDLSDSVESEEQEFSDDSDVAREKEEKEAKAQQEADAIRKKKNKEEKKLSYEELEAQKKARLRELRKAAKESSDDDSDEPRQGEPTADRFTEDNTHLFGSAKEAKIIPKMPLNYFGPCELKDFPLKTREDFVNLAEDLGDKMSTSNPEFVEDFLLELLVPLLKKLDTVHTNQIYKICEVAYNLKCRAEIEANKRKKKKKYADRTETKVKSYDPNFREDDSDDGDFDAFM